MTTSQVKTFQHLYGLDSVGLLYARWAVERPTEGRCDSAHAITTRQNPALLILRYGAALLEIREQSELRVGPINSAAQKGRKLGMEIRYIRTEVSIVPLSAAERKYGQEY